MKSKKYLRVLAKKRYNNKIAALRRNAVQINSTNFVNSVFGNDDLSINGDVNKCLISTKKVTVVKETNQNSKLNVDDSSNSISNLVLYEISRLQDKIDSLTEMVSKSINREKPEVEIDTRVESLDIFMGKLPVRDEESLEKLEKFLENRENYKIAISELSRIGGTNMGQATRGLLYKSLENNVAALYSWDGRRGKFAFKNLKLARSIVDAIKINFKDRTENEIIKAIRNWLVQTKVNTKERSKEKLI